MRKIVIESAIMFVLSLAFIFVVFLATTPDLRNILKVAVYSKIIAVAFLLTVFFYFISTEDKDTKYPHSLNDWELYLDSSDVKDGDPSPSGESD